MIRFLILDNAAAKDVDLPKLFNEKIYKIRGNNHFPNF